MSIKGAAMSAWQDDMHPRNKGKFAPKNSGIGLQEGKHVETLKLRTNARGSLKVAMRDMLDKAGLHATLAKLPIASVAFVSKVKDPWTGTESESAGMYNRSIRMLQIKQKRAPGSWGKDFEPGKSFSMSHAAKTHDEAVARTALHEIGHHIFHTSPKLQAAAQEAYDSHPKHIEKTKAGKDKTVFTKPPAHGFSRYAEKSPSEYMSEALVAYTYHREALRAHDPTAFKLAQMMTRKIAAYKGHATRAANISAANRLAKK